MQHTGSPQESNISFAFAYFSLHVGGSPESEGGMGYQPFDRFLPMPSLSITSSAHCIRRRSLGGAPVARSRSTGVEVAVCVAVIVVEGADRVWAAEEGWYVVAGGIEGVGDN